MSSPLLISINIVSFDQETEKKTKKWSDWNPGTHTY